MRSFLRNRRFKNFAFKTDVLCSCLLLNSKGKTIETTIGAGKEYTVSLEDHSIYMLVYYELGNGNINDGSVNCAVIVSRQADEKTGGIYTTATSSEEDISLENNILKITAGTWWVRVCIKKL